MYMKFEITFLTKQAIFEQVREGIRDKILVHWLGVRFLA